MRIRPGSSRIAIAGVGLLVACSDAASPPADASREDAARAGLDATVGEADIDAALREGGTDGGNSGDESVVPFPVDATIEAGTPPAIDAGNTAPGDDTPRCEIGAAEMRDAGWSFVPFRPGDTIPMVGGGQGSLSIELGLTVLDPTLPIDVRVVVRVIDSGRSRLVQRSMEDDFTCDGDNWCTLAPLYVPTWTLVDDPFDLMNLPVAITATFGDPQSPHCLATHTGELLRKM